MRKILGPGELSKVHLDWLKKTCEDSGVPLKVTDPTVIRKVAVLLGAPLPATPRQPSAPSPSEASEPPGASPDGTPHPSD